MQILTIRKGFKAFESKFEPFETDLKHSNANSNNSKGFWRILIEIRAIWKGLEAFEWDSKHSNGNSKHSKVIGSFRMQIRTIRKGFEAF